MDWEYSRGMDRRKETVRDNTMMRNTKPNVR